MLCSKKFCALQIAKRPDIGQLMRKVASDHLLDATGDHRTDENEQHGVNPMYHPSGKVNISFLGHMRTQIRRVGHSPNSNGVAWYYTHLQ